MPTLLLGGNKEKTKKSIRNQTVDIYLCMAFDILISISVFCYSLHAVMFELMTTLG